MGSASSRQSHLPVPARWQRRGVAGPGPVRAQGVHVVRQRRAPGVRGRAAAGRQPGRPVRQLGPDGLQRGLRHRLLRVLLR